MFHIILIIFRSKPKEFRTDRIGAGIDPLARISNVHKCPRMEGDKAASRKAHRGHFWGCLRGNKAFRIGVCTFRG